PASAVLRTSPPPRAPGLSLAGFQLVVALTTPWGSPCCVRFHCVHAVATTPAQRLGVILRSFTPAVSAKGLSGRPAHRTFRGLLGFHSRTPLVSDLDTIVTTAWKARIEARDRIGSASPADEVGQRTEPVR